MGRMWLLFVSLLFLEKNLAFEPIECRGDEYACADRMQCIPKESFCDQAPDCNDQSDEIFFDPAFHIPEDGVSCRSWYDLRLNCLLPAITGQNPDDYCNEDSRCPEGYFKCADGAFCIPKTLFCDGTPTCDDGSDELSFRKGKHYDGIKCRGWLDLKKFCHLPSDQATSMICNTDSKCAPDYFMCSSGDACIHARDFCSGMQNCKDGSDELKYDRTKQKELGIACRGCHLPSMFHQSYNDICLIDCKEDSFMCSDGTQCIEKFQFCDGTPDCSDGSDEIKYKRSMSGEKCQSWITLGKFCTLPAKHDQDPDAVCNKGSECPAGFYQCNDGSCIMAEQFCNGLADCSDGSDEIAYNGTTFQAEDGYPCVRISYPGPCILGKKNEKYKQKFCDAVYCEPTGFMNCMNGIECIPRGLICNGIADCSDGSDENPDLGPGSGELCRSWVELKETCRIPKTALNGGNNDAEALCRPKEDMECLRLEFKCADGSRCIEWIRFCDGTGDCDDGSDEVAGNEYDENSNCRSKTSGDVCSLPAKYDRRLFCFDPAEDCQPAEEMFQCADGTQCFPKKAFCNGFKDCRDGSDEVVFNRKIHRGKGVSCRGWVDLSTVCLLPADQKQKKKTLCNEESICLPLDFKCSDGKRCLFRLEFCNGEENCEDGSDEILYDPNKYLPVDGIQCRNPLTDAFCLLPTDQDSSQLCATETCPPEQFKCSNGQCIQREWFCNESPECSDGSDEIGYVDSPPSVGLKCKGYNSSPKYCLLPPGNDPQALCQPE